MSSGQETAQTAQRWFQGKRVPLYFVVGGSLLGLPLFLCRLWLEGFAIFLGAHLQSPYNPYCSTHSVKHSEVIAGPLSWLALNRYFHSQVSSIQSNYVLPIPERRVLLPLSQAQPCT